MRRRSRAREVAMQVLYEADLNPGVAAEGRERFLTDRLRSAPLIAFAASLIAGVERRREEIDGLLEARSRNWRVARMAITDRSVLRIAMHELLDTETPGAVVVDEAIELARRYGNEESPRFVAGILGAVLADLSATPPGA